MHGLGHLFTVGDRLHHGACALHRVAGGKHARPAGAAHLVGDEQAAVVHFQTLGALGDGGAGALTDGHDDAVGGVQHLGARLLGEGAVLGLLQVPEDHARIGDLHRLFVVQEIHALQFGVAGLVIAGGDFFGDGEALHMAAAVAYGGTRHIHGRVARADDDDAVPQMVHIGVLQVVDGVMHMAKALALDFQRVGTPHAGADEDGLVAVPEQVVHLEGLAHIGVGTHLDVLEAQMAVLEIVQHRLGQAEFRDAVAQHAADLVVALKDGHIVAVAGQNDRDGQTGRAGTDDGHPLAVRLCRAVGHLAGIGGGNVVFNDGKVHRRALDAADTVTLALVLVVADEAANGGQGVVLKQHPARLIELVVLEQADDLRDVGVDGAALLTAGIFAPQTVVGFVHYVQCHDVLLVSHQFCAE